MAEIEYSSRTESGEKGGGVMPKTNYQSGARAERLLRAKLKRHGYEVVRSAGSKGMFDLVAWNTTIIRFIQVKSGDAPTKEALTDIDNCKLPPNSFAELWHYTNGAWQVMVCKSFSGGFISPQTVMEEFV